MEDDVTGQLESADRLDKAQTRWALPAVIYSHLQGQLPQRAPKIIKEKAATA